MDTAIRTSSSPLIKAAAIAAASVASTAFLPVDSGEDCWHLPKPKGNKKARKSRNKAQKAARRRNRR